jgi:anti-anti-sigma factor
MAHAGVPVSGGIPPELASPPPVVWREGPRMVVALRGAQDATTAAGVADALGGAAVLGDSDVVVDLSGVRSMDAAIVAVLARGRDDLGAQARRLTLRSPSRSARDVLGTSRLVGLIDRSPGALPTNIGSCVTLRGAWSPAG